MVHQNGEYYIANKDGASRPKSVVDWTKHAAIVKQADRGREVNTLGIEVQGANVVFKVNGIEVTRLAKDRVHTDNLVGFRIGHNLDIDADQVSR